MHRRQFITMLSGAAAWPLAARAQQPAMPVIGFLYPQYQDTADLVLSPFREGLREQGYVEGRNLLIKYALAQNQRERLPMMAAALVREQVAAIATVGDGATLAAKAATQSIPVIFNVGTDPVESRIVASLNRPGGNLTGTMNLNTEVIEKRLELLHQVQPAASTIAYLTNARGAGEANIKRAQRAAGALGVRLLFVGVSPSGDLEAAFATIIEQGAGGLQIDTDPFLESGPVSGQIIALAAQNGIPVVYPYPEVPAAGGLMSYGTDYTENWRVTGVYTGRILKGERPANLPVQQATKMHLVINLKTAKTLGLTIPPALLAIADEVIE